MHELSWIRPVRDLVTIIKAKLEPPPTVYVYPQQAEYMFKTSTQLIDLVSATLLISNYDKVVGAPKTGRRSPGCCFVLRGQTWLSVFLFLFVSRFSFLWLD